MPTVPTRFPARMKTGVGCGEMALESSGKNICSQRRSKHRSTAWLKERGRMDSERQGGSRVALGLRKESTPDVFSNWGSEERVKWQALPKDF